jgi:hypothetical protein
MDMIRVILTLVSLIGPAVNVDQPRHQWKFTSDNGQYELKLISRMGERPFVWALFDKKSKKTLYKLAGDFASRTALIGNDGMRIVVIDDWSERLVASKDLEMLLFFRNGALTKKYLLGDLLKDTSDISESASHFSWFSPDGRPTFKSGKIKLTTYELRHYEFDFLTGEIISQSTDPLIGPNTVYVYGPVKKKTESQYEIEVCHQVYGRAPSTGVIHFEADPPTMRPYSLEDPEYLTVIINEGKCVAVKPFMFNQCNYRKNRRQ